MENLSLSHSNPLCFWDPIFASSASGAVDLLFLLTVALSGSLHCAGMCGALSSSYALPVSQKFPKQLWRYHVSYIAGRLLSYAWVGAFFGSLGTGFAYATGSFNALKFWGAAVAGTVMIAGGLASLLQHQWPKTLNQGFSKILLIVLRPIQMISIFSGPWKVFPLGMTSVILPCGLMWAVELRAFASQSIGMGSLIMLLLCADDSQCDSDQHTADTPLPSTAVPFHTTSRNWSDRHGSPPAVEGLF